MVPCVRMEHQEELKKAQVLGKGECAGSHERCVGQAQRGEQNGATMRMAYVCGCAYIRTKKHSVALTAYGGGPVGEMVESRGDKSLLEFKFLSAARSSERNERSPAVVISESGELTANGLVNWGGEKRVSEGGAAAYISEEGLERVLVGRDDLRNL